MGYVGHLKVLNILMMQSCTARILEAVCKNANLKLERKFNHKSGRYTYSVEGSKFMFVKEATEKAIFECELNGHWIEKFEIKDTHGFPVFKRTEVTKEASEELKQI